LHNPVIGGADRFSCSLAGEPSPPAGATSIVAIRDLGFCRNVTRKLSEPYWLGVARDLWDRAT
jgi:hypothetical protein